MDPQDKALIASSEFDPNNFIKGIDQMTGALEKLNAQEDALRQDLKATNTALQANRAEYKQTSDAITGLDKTAKTYADDLKKLKDQQATLIVQQKELRTTYAGQKTALAEVNQSAIQYKNAIAGIGAISKQVAQENKGRTLFDVASMNQQVAQVTALGSKLQNIFKGKIDTAELDRFEAELAQAGDEMQQLAQVVAFVKTKLDTLDPNSQEFADLNQIIRTGDEVLEAYNKTLDDTDKKSGSLRARLTAMRTELVEMEQQGKDNTKEFQNLQIAAGKLADEIGDAQNRIRVLSSDTKNLDFGIGVIRGAAAAMGTFEGAAALAGLKNEDLMQSIQRLNGLLVIMNGLQEIQNLLQKESVVRIVGQEIATKAAAAAQRIYALAVGTSTGAMRAFRIALLATGLGAFVVLLGIVTNAFGLFDTAGKSAMQSTDDLTDAIKRQDDALKDLNDTLDFASKLRIEKMKQNGASEQKIFGEQVKARNAQILNLVDAYDQADLRLNTFLTERSNRAAETQGKISKKEREQRNEQEKILRDDLKKRDEDLTGARRELTLFAATEDTKRVQNTRQALDAQAKAYEAYLERLKTLQRQLRDKTLEAQPQNETALRQGLMNQLGDLTNDIDREVKTGKLSKQQGAVLKSLVKKINKVDLDKALADFAKQVAESMRDLDEQITDLQLQSAGERANLLRDTLGREAAVVAEEFKRDTANLIREREALLRGISESQTQGILTPEQAKAHADRVQAVYTQLLENLATATSRKQEEITARTFDAAMQQLSDIFGTVGVIVSEGFTEEIIKLTRQYTTGELTYEKYQKELTRITAEESKKRIQLQIDEQQGLLDGVLARIKAEQDPERLKGLQDQERALRANISNLKRELAGADAEGTKRDQDDIAGRIGELAKYAVAISGIVTQVVQFWEAANQAEQRALERSISLQERRVDAAVRIAERGNAEYLRLEQDRLDELTVKQENAARRQLAINAVLQTSQALTAFISALAQGIATGGPIGGIAIAAAVIGLIASGYAIITSLQESNRVGLKKGTKAVKRKGEPAGDDTIAAMLTEGEAVIPADTNKAYAPAVAAIYDRAVPAEDMNAFVNSYRVNNRRLPRLDHDRMSDVAGVVITYDGQLLEATERQTRAMAEHNDLLRKVDRRLANMGITANIDRHGLAISLMKATEQFAIDKKS
jgi:DNA repair exonuclease SbcCD ATPase subunit